MAVTARRRIAGAAAFAALAIVAAAARTISAVAEPVVVIRWWSPWALPSVPLAAAGVGASRVHLGVCWPADVVTGSLFAEGGCAWSPRSRGPRHEVTSPPHEEG